MADLESVPRRGPVLEPGASQWTSMQFEDFSRVPGIITAPGMPPVVFCAVAKGGSTSFFSWLYRTRAHWRKFPLRKTEDGFALYDEKDSEVASATSLDDLLEAVESIPGLADGPAS